MFIVIPKISSIPSIYGIYILCISMMIFLRYSDLGFLKAGYKYASEYYAKNDQIREIEIIGFSTFIMFLFVFLFAITFLIISFFPELLIKDLQNHNEIVIASQLLLIVSVFSFSTIIQRFNDTVFGIRVEGYINQKIQIIASFIKIASVFYFFNNRYDIVGYFLFFQSMNLIGSIISCIIIKVRYNYDFKLVAKSFKYSNRVYKEVKKLAFSSLYITFMWILFYELDNFVIAKYYGAESVAIYSIGFTILTYFRLINGIIYNPIPARFNHFKGENNIEGLKIFYKNIIVLTVPFILIPIISAFLLIEPLIINWVGVQYIESINIAAFLIIVNVTAFISIPSSTILFALEKVKPIFVINTLMAGTFWIGVLFTSKYWGIQSFAIFKFISVMVVSILYLRISLQVLKIGFNDFIKLLSPIILPIIFLFISLKYIEKYIPVGQGTYNLMLVILIGGLFSFLTLVLYYIFSSDFKKYINNLFVSIHGWYILKLN